VKTDNILIQDIERGGRLRATDPARVKALASSIRDIGLRTPVTVVAIHLDGEVTYRLVAGAHRIEAVQSLGEDYIEAIIMDGSEDAAALWEIDENFARSELTDAQRADHHVRREAILVRMGEVAAGGKGGDRRSTDKLSVGYATKAAADLGVDERTVRRDLRRGKNIAPDVLAEVAGTDMDKGVVLDALASVPQADQRAKLAEITLRRQEAERMRKEAETANRNTDRVIAITDAEWLAEWILARSDLDEVSVIIGRATGAKMSDVIAALKRGAA
jgi:ParB-like chromosome segregation protein Spo0J